MMSELLSSEGVQYILNDSELVVDQPEITENLNDIIYQDGSTAILVNGHVLQGDDDTFILNEEGLGKIFITDGEDTSNNEFEQSEFVQYIDDNYSVNPLEEHQIFYINEDQSDFHFATSDDIITEENDQMKFETEVVDVDNFIKFEESDESDVVCSQSGFQYAILKDGKLHLQPCESQYITDITDDNLFHQVESEEESFSTVKNGIVDVSSITGRNLLTGQKVTLDSYLGKLKKNLKNSEKKGSSTADAVIRRKFLLNSLLNKKFKLGKTANGKQLVGKIIQIRHNNEDKEVTPDECVTIEDSEQEHTSQSHEPDETENSADSIKAQNLKGNKIVVSKSVPKETFDHVSRTIEGLMAMDSVKKKLENKKVLVKLMEKHWLSDLQRYKRTISFISGHMYHDQRDGNSRWSFLNDIDSEDSRKGTDEKMKQFIRKTHPELETLTIIMTYNKNHERQVKVILNQSKVIKCTICQKEFRSNFHLKAHMNLKHDTSAESNVQKNTPEDMVEGRPLRITDEVHETNSESNPMECYICFDRFSSQILLHEHLCTHINNQYFCETCGDCFLDLDSFISHQKTHGSSRFVCKICNRTFSRQANLHRHEEIHKGVGNIYECDICGCSYHFISSLTRHVVQNHLKH